ncbi:MAG: hypothetical protein ACP5QO_11350 [Clostridia bacterium]
MANPVSRGGERAAMAHSQPLADGALVTAGGNLVTERLIRGRFWAAERAAIAPGGA